MSPQLDDQTNSMRIHFAILSALILLTPLAADAARHTKGREVSPFSSELKPGDYLWHPEVSPEGPVVIIVSLPGQTMYVYRNGVRIGRSTVSTGTKGHPTPTGIFTILQKKVDHESNIYKGAKMPHMQRLTWTGIAMHAGNLPGYPASHGCVRLPADFARLLFSVTNNSTSVIVTDDTFAPGETAEPGRLLSGKTGESYLPELTDRKSQWHPERSPTGPLSIIVSTADKQVYVYRNAIEIGRAAFSAKGLSPGFGSHVYSALRRVDQNGQREWLSTATFGPLPSPNLKKLVGQLIIDPNFLKDVRAAVDPGTTLILTDIAVTDQTQSAPGFNIMTSE